MPKRSRDLHEVVLEEPRSSSHYRPANREELALFFRAIYEVLEERTVDLPQHDDLAKMSNGETEFFWTEKCDRELEALESATGVDFFTVIEDDVKEEENDSPCTCDDLCSCKWDFCEVQ